MLKKIFSLTAAALLLFACTDDEWPAQPDWSQIPNPDEEVDDGLLKPAACTNNIVAHRGGATECKAPDNSLASLRYAIGQGCYGSECDIYWTKDDNVVVAHADGQCKINGMHPWEHTLAELRAGGGLSNGEQLPSLEDFLGEVMKEGCPTRLWLDIKNITYPSTLTEYAINAARRSCEIATEMGAKHFVEFICTGNTTVMKSAFAYAGAAGIPIGWMSNRPASEYVGLGYSWANLSAASYMSAEAGGKGTRTLEEFEKEGVALSVFNVDRQAGDGNAVYTTEAVDYYCSAAGRFKALCTNYPAWLIEKVEAATKVYDGIRSEADLRAFAAEVAVDPTAERFQNAAGEVVLHTDIAVSEAWTPIAGFAGVVRRQRQDAHGELFGQRRTGGNLRHARRYGEEPAGGRLVHDDRDGQGDAGCRRRQAGREGADRGLYEYGRHRDERRCERYDRDRRNLRSGSCPATSSRTIPTRGGSPSAARRRATLRPWPVSAAGPTRTLRAASTRARSVTRTRCRQPRPSMWAAYWAGSISERGMSWRTAATRPPSRWRPPRRPTTCWAASAGLRQRREPRYAQHDPATARIGATFWPMPPCRTRRRPVRPAWAGICGGTAVFEGNTNYGKVEARGGGKGASEFSNRRYQRHDRARCDRLPQLRRRAQQHRQGESSRPYRRSVRMGDARLHDHRLRAGCRRGVDDALQLRRRQRVRPPIRRTRTAAARAFWSDASSRRSR